MIRQAVSVTLIVLWVYSVGSASDVDSIWYFTSSEIDTAYRYQEHFGQRLQRSVKPNDCYQGQMEFTASVQGKEISGPCQFLTQTIQHLKQMLEIGAARYLFPLDADHAHLAIPTGLWSKKYSHLAFVQVLPGLLREPKLIALYHTAEHLMITDLEAGKESGITKRWRAKRNVLGFFDGRPLQILPPRPDGLAHDIPEDHTNLGTIKFLAHRLGELVFSASGKAVPFDISFDEEVGTNIP